MRDGIYSFRYDAFGHLSRGSLRVRDGLAHGRDTRAQIEGALALAASNVTATLEVTAVDRPGPVDRHEIRDFSLRLTGTGSDTHFDLIGVGPRGLIVVFAGEWMAPLAANA